MASCQGVKTYAAAKILHRIGASGFAYILDIIIADTSSMRDWALALTFARSPFLVTTFVGVVAAQWFLRYRAHGAHLLLYLAFRRLWWLYLSPSFSNPIPRKQRSLGYSGRPSQPALGQKHIGTTVSSSMLCFYFLASHDHPLTVRPAFGVTLAGAGLTLPRYGYCRFRSPDQLESDGHRP